MGRLSTLTILLTLSAWGVATDGAPPDDAAPPSGASARPNPPAPPVEYVRAGARLFNSGDYERAGKYLRAANTYRDQLTENERIVLDEYLHALEQATHPEATPAPAAAPAPSAPAPAPVPTPAQTAMTAALGGGTAGQAPPPARLATGRAGQPQSQAVPTTQGGTADDKQKARWLLQAAREQIRLGDYDGAAAKVAEVRAMNIKWGLFDDTPDKVAEAIEKFRPKTPATTSTGGPHTHREARAKLKEARNLLAQNRYEQAEAIALEVGSWGLSYGFFEDSPSKVGAAARALRQRDAARKMGPRGQAQNELYALYVREARDLMKAGKLDAAEAKARQAQRVTGAYPDANADRAEAVLHDISLARAQATAPAATVAAANPALAGIAAEREANTLLGSGQREAAAAKFAEADRLQANAATTPTPMSTTTPAPPPLPSDPSVQKTQVKLEAPPEAQAPATLEPAPVTPPAPTTPAATEPVPANPPADAVPAPAPAPASAPEAAAAPAEAPTAPAPPPPSNPGEQLLEQARSLYTSGNYPAAREAANKAKTGGYGVEAQADDLLAQIALAEQGGALQLYEAALAALRKGEPGRARALLTEVAAAGAALDEGLQQKVQDLLLKLPKDDTGQATTTEADTQIDASVVEAQRLNAEVGTKVAQARRLLETEPDKAIALLQETMTAVKAAQIPEAASKTLVRRLEVALELAQKDKAAFDRKMKDRAKKLEIEEKKLRILEADKAKLEQMKSLMERAQKAYADGKLEEAEVLAKRAREIDPNELAAIALEWKARTERHYKTYVANKAAKEEGVLEAWHEVDEAAIAPTEVQRNSIMYPKTWKELTENRRRINKRLEYRKDPKTLEIEDKLNKPVSLNIDKQPLSEAISFLQQYTGINIVLDTKALSEESLTSASPVSLTVNDIKLKSALRLMLRPLGLTYKVEDEVLLITSPQADLGSTIVRTYSVADLVVPPSHDLPNINEQLQVPHNPVATQAAAMARGGVSPLPATAGGVADGGTPVSQTRNVTPEMMMPLVNLIVNTIAPGTWRVLDQSGADQSAAYGLGGGLGGAGGDGLGQSQPIGAIIPYFLSISLIIRHTAEVHEDIQDLLRQLRRLQDLQISVEVRFIDVSDNWFEQIGVSFDFDIQSAVGGPKNAFAQPLINFGTTTSATTTTGTTGGVGGVATTGTTGTTGTTTTTGTTGTTGAAGTTGSVGGGNIGGAVGGVTATGGVGGFGGGIGGATTSAVGVSTSGTGSIFLINPYRDHSLGRQPVVIGEASTAPGNFTNNLVIPFTQGSADVIAPFNSIPSAGAQFGIAFLSDLEMYLFLTAATGDARANIVQAPKVTTFNGATARIQSTIQRYYVQELIPIVGPGSVAFFPIPGSIPDGVTLFVTPVVSADRRYVRLSLSPFFIGFVDFATFPIPAAVGGGGLAGQAVSINGQIQLPEITITTVLTTVTVPDGGTVLLGGVKRLREERREFGVPILSKIPYIDRLFRNIGIGRTTESLMLMVTPRIIILEEEEERLGIPTVTF